MKRERVSLGELAFSHLSLPDWAKEKLKHWPWIVFFAGAVLALKIGFGLPVEFKTELPFVEWKDGGASEINGTALAVGVACLSAISARASFSRNLTTKGIAIGRGS
jgi:hypothetical protein